MAKKETIPPGHQKCIFCGRIKPVDDFPPYYRFWARDQMRMPDCWDCRFEAALSRMGTVKRNPVIAFVRDAVRKAVKHGYLERTGRCQCGSVGKHKHHPNYRRPLDVIYLCDDCHKEFHRIERAIVRENGSIPEHYIYKYLKRVGLRGQEYILRPGAPRLQPKPYRTNYHRPMATLMAAV